MAWPDGKFPQLDNSRLLVILKAKALKSLIESSPAFKKHCRDVPYVAECVFLSDPNPVSELNPQGRFQVFGRDGDTRDAPSHLNALRSA